MKDGNLTGVSCVSLFSIGLGVVYISGEWFQNYFTKMIGFSIGMTLMAIGGYAAKASTLRLRPFGESPWRKAKRTYEQSDDPG